MPPKAHLNLEGYSSLGPRIDSLPQTTTIGSPHISDFESTRVDYPQPVMSQAYTEEWLVGPQATNFYTRTYTPTVPTTAAVVFVHGFAEHIGRYTHFHPLLAARGIAVFTYDSRGFGLTALDTTGKKSKSSAYGKTSWKDQMGDVAWAIEHAKKTFNGVPLFLMGHSMVRTT